MLIFLGSEPVTPFPMVVYLFPDLTSVSLSMLSFCFVLYQEIRFLICLSCHELLFVNGPNDPARITLHHLSLKVDVCDIFRGTSSWANPQRQFLGITCNFKPECHIYYSDKNIVKIIFNNFPLLWQKPQVSAITKSSKAHLTLQISA